MLEKPTMTQVGNTHNDTCWEYPLMTQVGNNHNNMEITTMTCGYSQVGNTHNDICWKYPKLHKLEVPLDLEVFDK